MMQLTIDGRRYKAAPGQTLLEVARANNIEIPALCYHEGVEAWGGCRLCLVEITKPQWAGWSKLVTACLYPAEDGLTVRTDSADVREVRRTVLELLMARCPDSGVIRDLARQYGVEATELVPDQRPAEDNCILCGLCVRVCAAVGANAIATASRGADKVLATPFHEPPPDCIGCATCAKACPTHTIPFARENGRVHIWDRDFELVKCPACGKEYMTVEEREHYLKKTGLPREYFDTCEDCRRAEAGRQLSQVLSATAL